MTTRGKTKDFVSFKHKKKKTNSKEKGRKHGTVCTNSFKGYPSLKKSHEWFKGKRQNKHVTPTYLAFTCGLKKRRKGKTNA